MKETVRFYDFANFRLDLKNKVLLQDGENISITPKVFDTLQLLLNNQSELIEKDRFMQEVWKDSFVEESNLTFNIKMLRKALGDNAGNPIFIQTVPKRGYRFICEVETITDEQDLEKESHNLQEQSKTEPFTIFSKLKIAFVLVLLGLIITTVFASWMIRSEPLAKVPILTKKFEMQKLTDTGKVFHSAVSPDGKIIAYNRRFNETESLWIRDLETDKNTEIISPTADFYYGIIFSNDGRNLFFTRKNKSKPLDIFRVSVSGGIPDKIIENSQGVISLSPDDKKIAFIRYENGVGDRNKLFIADADGKNEELIKESEVGKVFWNAAFSPDGKRIAFGYGHTNNASQDMILAEIDLQNRRQRQLSANKFFNVKNIEWLPNENGLMISATEHIGEPDKIWLLDLSDDVLTSLTNDTYSYTSLSLSKNSDKLSAITIDADFHLFIGSENAPNELKEVSQARDGFTFTADQKIVYASDTSGAEDIWIMDADGSNQRQLTNDKFMDSIPIVSADNKYIYFSSNRTGKMQVWQMNLDGTEQKQITKIEGGFPMLATPDGEWLYFQKNVSLGIWKISLKTGEESEIIAKKSEPFCAFSPEGKNLACVARNKESGKYQIEVMDTETKHIEKTFPTPENTGVPIYLNWNNFDNTISYTVSDAKKNNSLWIQNLEETSPKHFADTENDETMECKFSPDGKNFAVIKGSWKHDAVLLSGLK